MIDLQYAEIHSSSNLPKVYDNVDIQFPISHEIPGLPYQS